MNGLHSAGVGLVNRTPNTAFQCPNSFNKRVNSVPVKVLDDFQGE